MSREIKFRAWTKYKWMGEVISLCHQGDTFVKLHSGEGASPFRIDDIELMQYTGFKDKKGQEIYEGDLLRWDGNATTCFPVIFSVEDGSWIFQIEPFSEFDEPKMLADFAPFSEVVGNIYENPELLEE